MADAPRTAHSLSEIGAGALSRKAYPKGGSMACNTPGKKIRSKGKGRGLAIGNGQGPIGVPVGVKNMNVRQPIQKKKK